jgi:uncharacterized protein YjbI with pentapeptide repeats
MICQNGVIDNKKLYESLKIDCEKCFGLCCVALYFSASDGFPKDKVAGTPCSNLNQEFRCAIHKDLRAKGCKGCTSYDCFGAGQKVAQVTYEGYDWRQVKQSAKQMMDVFLIMRQLHEILWYLAEAFRVQTNKKVKDKLIELISETEQLTYLKQDSLIKLDVESHRDKARTLFHQTSELIRANALNGKKSALKHGKMIAGRLDFMGVDLRKANLRGADLRGAFLIAANLSGTDLSGADLIGADLRDADVRGTNLEDSIFITQAQINAAVGNSDTKLPISLSRPGYWQK